LFELLVDVKLQTWNSFKESLLNYKWLCLRTPNQILKTAGCIDGCIVNRYICFKVVLYFLFSCMHFSVLCSVFFLGEFYKAI